MVKSVAWEWKSVKKDDEEFWKTPAKEAYYLLDRWKKQGKKNILDLGSGIGRHSIFFAKDGFDVCAFDLSEDAIDKSRKWAQEERLKIDFKVGDMLELPYEDNCFDCIYCRNSISHSDTVGVKKTIGEVHRVLKDKGECYMTLGSKNTWGWKEDWEQVDENTKIRKDNGAENGIPHFYADLNLIYDLLSDFEIIDIQQIEDFHKIGSKHTSSFHYHILVKANKS